MPPKNRIIKKCTYCGKDIERPPSLFGNKPTAYCNRECQHQHYKTRYYRDGSPSWKGGKHITDQGYVRIRMPEHPRAVNGYVLEHILVVETMLGRPLSEKERIHHINHISDDNRPENLRVYKSNGDHLRDENHHKPTHYCKCGRKVKGHGLCCRHLGQLKRTGKTWDFENEYLKTSPGDGKKYTRQRNLICQCGKQAHCKGLCIKHYRYWISHKELPSEFENRNP